MEEMITGLVKKVGISEDQAKQVIEFLKENAHKVPEWIGQNEMAKDLVDKLPGGIGDMLK
ncbi:MAG: hypothetical protein JJ863_32825 [Deltaproteobacteria bacterium]|nr:hypothetical protein [Deltaproteobacteria bacterium]